MKLTKSKLKEIIREELLKEAPKGDTLWQTVSKDWVVAHVSLGKIAVSITIEVGPLHKQRDKYAYRIRWEIYGVNIRKSPLLFSEKLYDSQDEALKAGHKHYKKLKSKFRIDT